MNYKEIPLSYFEEDHLKELATYDDYEFERKEIVELLLKKSSNRLKDRHKIVIYHHFYLDMSLSEISRKFKRSSAWASKNKIDSLFYLKYWRTRIFPGVPKKEIKAMCLSERRCKYE